MQIFNAVNDALRLGVGALDRSNIVNQYGSGDIMGARISEERRTANLVSGFGSILGGIIGTVIAPGTGTAVGMGMGKMLGLPFEAIADIDATELSKAGLWQNKSGQAMELAAVMGSVNDVRGAFKTAADAAAEFGYSAEEGMDAMKQAAQQGLDGEAVRTVTQQTFDYERRTGADRGTLQGISTMAARYGAGDALGMGWAGVCKPPV